MDQQAVEQYIQQALASQEQRYGQTIEALKAEISNLKSEPEELNHRELFEPAHANTEAQASRHSQVRRHINNVGSLASGDQGQVTH